MCINLNALSIWVDCIMVYSSIRLIRSINNLDTVIRNYLEASNKLRKYKY